VNENKLTGNFSNENCCGKQKVKMLFEKYKDRDLYYSWAYGDRNGDKELSQIADEKFYKYF